MLPPERDVAKLVRSLINASLESQLVQERDVVTIVHGFLPGVSGTTNTIQVLDLQEYLASPPDELDDLGEAIQRPVPSI